ncbi:bifunctional riboflavin kinase/FAD synthetase [Chloroflexota bacterium]
MQVEEELAGLSPQQDMILAIGVFDGVHLGHQYLILKLKEEAGKQELLTGVITFHEHPQEVVSTDIKLPFLTDLKERSNLLKGAGVDAIISLTFTEELSQLSASQFVSLLQKHLRMRGLVIGSDFALGKQREGNIDVLRELGRKMNFSVNVVTPFRVNGEVISSTAIRRAIADGDMEKVHRMVGRPFRLRGMVVSGAGRGAELGFPTANLDINQRQALPADGVYAGWAGINGNTYRAMINVGQCPTFDGSERTAEVHVVDYQGDLYGRELKVDIMQRLRGEVKFRSIDELKKQIMEDVRQGREILKAEGR